MREPYIGEVLVMEGAYFNGHSDQPAIVTQVWSRIGLSFGEAWCVNVCVLPDGAQPYHATSMYLMADPRTAAEAGHSLFLRRP